MKHYHVRTNDHHYGAANSLIGAMNNANVRVGLFAACCQSLEHGDWEDVQYNIDEPDAFEWCDGDTVGCIITITDTKKWEYDGSSMMDGSPVYNWLGEEADLPDLVESTTMKVLVNLDTGAITNVTDEA